MDKWTIYKKTDDFRVAAPKSVLDVVEIKSIDENGIFEEEMLEYSQRPIQLIIEVTLLPIPR